MTGEVREIIVDALKDNNFTVRYAGDLSNFIKQLDKKLYIQIYK